MSQCISWTLKTNQSNRVWLLAGGQDGEGGDRLLISVVLFEICHRSLMDCTATEMHGYSWSVLKHCAPCPSYCHTVCMESLPLHLLLHCYYITIVINIKLTTCYCRLLSHLHSENNVYFENINEKSVQKRNTVPTVPRDWVADYFYFCARDETEKVENGPRLDSSTTKL